MSLRSCYLPLMLCLWGPSLASAREWRDATGKFSVEAEFAGFDGTTVQLKKVDNVVISIPLSRLSQSDQQFVRRNNTVIYKKANDALTESTAPTAYDVVMRAREVLVASHSEPTQKVRALRQIASVFAAQGSVEGTLATVQAVRDVFGDPFREIVLQESAEIMADSGHPAEAKRLAQGLTGHNLAAVLAHTSMEYARVGNRKQALADKDLAVRHARNAEVGEFGFEATAEIAKAIATLGMLEDAIAFAEAGNSPDLLAKSYIIAVLVEQKQVSKARAIFQKMHPSSPCTGVAAIELAKAYARRGDFTSAREVVDFLAPTMLLVPHRIQSLGAMAEAASRTQKQTLAHKLLNEASIIVDSFQRPTHTTLVCYLMDALVTGNEIDSAIERVEWVEKNLETLTSGTEAGLEVDVAGAHALLQIAERKLRAGEAEPAEKLYDRAERLLTSSEIMTEQRGRALRRLGRGWVRFADAPKAVKRAEGLSVSARVCVLAGIAEALTECEGLAEDEGQ